MKWTTGFQWSVAIALTSAGALAQSRLEAQPVRSPIKDRGVYHVASGTWTRVSVASGMASDTLYCNKAPSGYHFAGMLSSWELLNEARIPSTSSPAPFVGTADSYVIDGFAVSYCTSHVRQNTDMTWRFYDNYAPCSDPDAPANPLELVASFDAVGILPGSSMSGVNSCWSFAFDLANSGMEFELLADGDGVWDNATPTGTSVDTFGWSIVVNNNSLSGDGPVIAGQCPPANPAAGVGTVFNPGTGGQGDPNCTGLGSTDTFWIDGLPLTAGANGGCFFFGGCPQNPFGSFWFEVFGQPNDLGATFCVGTANSSGTSASINGFGSSVLADESLTLRASGLPTGAFGLFCFGPTALSGGAMLGNGALCVGGMVARMQPPAMAVMGSSSALRAFDFSADYASNPAITVGATANFQFWFRDPMGGGAGSNSSDGWQVTWE